MKTSLSHVTANVFHDQPLTGISNLDRIRNVNVSLFDLDPSVLKSEEGNFLSFRFTEHLLKFSDVHDRLFVLLNKDLLWNTIMASNVSTRLENGMLYCTFVQCTLLKAAVVWSGSTAKAYVHCSTNDMAGTVIQLEKENELEPVKKVSTRIPATTTACPIENHLKLLLHRRFYA